MGESAWPQLTSFDLFPLGLGNSHPEERPSLSQDKVKKFSSAWFTNQLYFLCLLFVVIEFGNFQPHFIRLKEPLRCDVIFCVYWSLLLSSIQSHFKFEVLIFLWFHPLTWIRILQKSETSCFFGHLRVPFSFLSIPHPNLNRFGDINNPVTTCGPEAVHDVATCLFFSFPSPFCLAVVVAWLS